jgi:hypothetical protein
MNNAKWYLLLVLSFLLYCYANYNDAKIAKAAGGGDFRNRIVGSRLVKDGIDPYFYHYKTGDKLQYVDMQNCHTNEISNISASPFFLKILNPICYKPQLFLNNALYIITQICFCLILLIVTYFQQTIRQKSVAYLILVGTLFWDAWIMNNFNKQTYFLFAFLYLLIYLALKSSILPKIQSTILEIFAGICIILLVLIKLNYIFLFLPFLMIFRKIKIALSTATFLGFLYIGIVFTHFYTKQLWQKYFAFLKISVEQVQGKYNITNNDPCPNITVLEGIDFKKNEKLLHNNPVHFNEETSNFFNILWFTNKSAIARPVLMFLMISIVSLILIITFFRNRKNPLALYQIFLIGFCCFIAADFYGPIFRHPYYANHWIIALAILLIHFENITKLSWILIFSALIIYVLPKFSNLQLTLAEQLLFFAVLIAGLQKNDSAKKMTTQIE